MNVCLFSGARYVFFFFNDTATTEIYTLSLHDALPIYVADAERAGEPRQRRRGLVGLPPPLRADGAGLHVGAHGESCAGARSEEHTSELQSRQYLVCRLLLEKKKKHYTYQPNIDMHTPS